MKYIMFFLLFTGIVFSAQAQPKGLVYIDVENFNMVRVAKGQAEITLGIRMYNPNNFKIKLKDGDIDVFIDDNRLGKVQGVDKFEVPKEDTCVIPVVLYVDLKAALPNALNLVLNNGIANVKLDGTVKAGRHGIFITVPVHYEGKQDIGAMLKLQ